MSIATRASLVLIGCCSIWAFSFPGMKALAQLGQQAEPNANSIFLSSLCIAIRFSVAASLLALWLGGRVFRFTRKELEQGGGLGLFGGLGLVLQMDGMTYTLASTSAFLTQGYAVLIPIWVGLTRRRFPGADVIGACGLAVGGAGILGYRASAEGGFQFGRGEVETLLGSAFFAAQILWLERPHFAANDSLRATTLMFAVMALACWVIVGGTAPAPRAILTVYSSPAALTLLGLLTGFCTLLTFPLANHWQPKVPATQAGLLYCSEPVFTSLVTLFVPGIISRTTGVDYPNEVLTWNLMLGGGLILAANVWLQLRPPGPTPVPLPNAG